MTTSEDERRQQALDSAVESLAREERVRGIWLFGSTREQRLWSASDVDLLVVAEGVRPAERWQEWEGILFHLHWYPPEALTPDRGIAAAQRAAGGGTLLYHDAPRWKQRDDALTAFDEPLRRTHLLPHLEALARWARDLRQRMAIGDERPRRAAARQWEVDNHAASILLIEAGHHPGGEPTRQALNARLFVPTMLDPDEIEQFVRARLGQWLPPLWQGWEGAFDAADLAVEHGMEPFPRLLEQAVAAGLLTVVQEDTSADHPLGRRLYQPYDA